MDYSTPASLSLTISRSLPKFMSIALVMPSGHLSLWRPLLLLPLKPETKRMEGGIHGRLWSISWKDESVVKLGLWKVENTFIIIFKIMRMNSNKYGKRGEKHIFEKKEVKIWGFKTWCGDCVGDCLSSSSQSPFSERDPPPYMKSTSSTLGDWLRGGHVTELINLIFALTLGYEIQCVVFLELRWCKLNFSDFTDHMFRGAAEQVCRGEKVRAPEEK